MMPMVVRAFSDEFDRGSQNENAVQTPGESVGVGVGAPAPAVLKTSKKA
jgi:hypothetical protein